MTQPVQLQHDNTHVTPVVCPICHGHAPLIQRGPNAFLRDAKTEIWFFRFEDRGQEFSKTVESQCRFGRLPEYVFPT